MKIKYAGESYRFISDTEHDSILLREISSREFETTPVFQDIDHKHRPKTEPYLFLIPISRVMSDKKVNNISITPAENGYTVNINYAIPMGHHEDPYDYSDYSKMYIATEPKDVLDIVRKLLED